MSPGSEADIVLPSGANDVARRIALEIELPLYAVAALTEELAPA